MTYSVYAQSNPIIEIVLSQPTAKFGDIVKADVYIRNATNLGGADIGIKVDDTCLRISNRTAGTFVASTGENGGFSPFSEQHDHDTRFAAAITDRSKLANGEGVFYSVDLQVICENGVAPLTVVFGELSAYKDPNAAQIEFLAYTLTAKTTSAINTQLIVGSAVAPTATVGPTAAPGEQQVAPTAVAGSRTATPVPAAEAASQPPVTLIAVICLSGVGLLILIAAFVILRRRKDEDEDDEVEES